MEMHPVLDSKITLTAFVFPKHVKCKEMHPTLDSQITLRVFFFGKTCFKYGNASNPGYFDSFYRANKVTFTNLPHPGFKDYYFSLRVFANIVLFALQMQLVPSSMVTNDH